LALVSAALWGAGDFAGGVATRLSSNLVAVLGGQAVGLLLSLVLLTLSAEARPGAEALGWSAVAGVSGASGLFAFYLALSRGAMGLVAPLTALIAAAIPAMVGLVRGDGATVLVLVGMVMALVAVVVISLPGRSVGAAGLPQGRGARLREWLLIILAGLGFAGFFLAIDASHHAGGAVWWPLFAVKVGGTGVALSVVIVLLVLRRAPPLRIGLAALMMAALSGVGDLGGNLFFVMASDIGDLAVVVVLSSLYPVGTAIMARVFLHERLGRVRLAGVGLAIGAVALIGFGSV
jgi:uncharacterized membrane protein